MSPEQYRAEPLDARSDQFSFCVALHEGLFASRPFAGDTIEDLRRAVLDGVVTPPSSRSDLPGFVHRAMMRGLSRDPADRFPDMAALLDALTRGPRWPPPGTALVRWALIALVVIAAGAGIVAYEARTPRDRAPDDAVTIASGPRRTGYPRQIAITFDGKLGSSPGANWFATATASCTAGTAAGYIAAHPPPPTINGTAFQAACETLAGQPDRVTEIIDSVAPESREEAATPAVNVVAAMALLQPDDPVLPQLARILVPFEPRWALPKYLAGAVAYLQGDPQAQRYLTQFRASATTARDRTFLATADALLGELATPSGQCDKPVAQDPTGLQFYGFRCGR
jgi:hypothetical protein